MTDHSETGIIRRELDPEGDEPGMEVVWAVADLTEKDIDEVANMYDCLDHVLDHIFSNPPSPEAQVEITFSYEGFRITVDQDGIAKFVTTG